jgi:hypothetical protein
MIGPLSVSCTPYVPIKQDWVAVSMHPCMQDQQLGTAKATHVRSGRGAIDHGPEDQMNVHAGTRHVMACIMHAHAVPRPVKSHANHSASGIQCSFGRHQIAIGVVVVVV